MYQISLSGYFGGGEGWFIRYGPYLYLGNRYCSIITNIELISNYCNQNSSYTCTRFHYEKGDCNKSIMLAIHRFLVNL